jgi:hypothetical protein
VSSKLPKLGKTIKSLKRIKKVYDKAIGDIEKHKRVAEMYATKAANLEILLHRANVRIKRLEEGLPEHIEIDQASATMLIEDCQRVDL